LKVGELIMEDLGSQLEETLIHEAHFKAAKDEVMIVCLSFGRCIFDSPQDHV